MENPFIDTDYLHVTIAFSMRIYCTRSKPSLKYFFKFIKMDTNNAPTNVNISVWLLNGIISSVNNLV